MPILLDYHTPSKNGNVPRWIAIRYAVLTGIATGWIQGLAWLAVGEMIDGPLGNVTAWFVVPVVLPLFIAGGFLLWLKSSRTHVWLSALVFVVSFYLSHLVPLLCAVLPFYVGHINP